MYKVLWFDDEHEKFELDKESALLENVNLIGFSNALEGIKEMLDNYSNYHAVVLDGKFYSEPNQFENSLSDQAFGQVAKEIDNLRIKNIILPCFIYSGQKNFVKEENIMVKVFKDVSHDQGRIFSKTKDDDFIELLSEIKKAANNQPITQARHNNQEIFQIFEQGYLPYSVEQNVLNLLIQPLPSNNSELKSILTNIRSIQESCFVQLQNIGVLHSNLSSLNDKLKHLEGNVKKENGWKPTSMVYLSKEIKNLHEWIYYTCGAYIHYLDEQHHDGYMISNYAVESLRQGVLEILLWFKKTYKAHK